MVMQVTPQQSLDWECSTYGRCDLTDAETQGHFGFCVALRKCQQERGALFILILKAFEATLPEQQSLAVDNLRRSEGSAWLGRDLRWMGSAARLGTPPYLP